MRNSMFASHVVLSLLALVFVVPASTYAAAQHGFGLQISDYGVSDEATERTFDIDSGPIPQAYYRFQTGAHSVFAGIGIESWDRSEPFVSNSLDFITLFANYRYLPWHDKPVSLFVGGGLAYIIYDANLASGSTIEAQTGLVLAVEPLVGVEFMANRKIRLGLEAKYSEQLFSTEDFDDLAAFTDVDLGGFYATFSVSFMFGD